MLVIEISAWTWWVQQYRSSKAYKKTSLRHCMAGFIQNVYCDWMENPREDKKEIMNLLLLDPVEILDGVRVETSSTPSGMCDLALNIIFHSRVFPASFQSAGTAIFFQGLLCSNNIHRRSHHFPQQSQQCTLLLTSRQSRPPPTTSSQIMSCFPSVSSPTRYSEWGFIFPSLL